MAQRRRTGDRSEAQWPGKTAKKSAKVAKKAAAKRVAATPPPSPNPPRGRKPILLSGGNPQIAKGDGDAPVQAYIAAMPGWKRDLGRRLDALIERAVPDVRKAVKWNSPFYGVEGNVWFLTLHCFTKYVKVTFFRGTSLHPVPPGASKHKDVRYLDIYEDAARRSAVRRLGEASQPIARRTHVSGGGATPLRRYAMPLETFQDEKGGDMTTSMTPRTTRRHLLAGGAAALLTSLGALRHASARPRRPAGWTTRYSPSSRPSRSS